MSWRRPASGIVLGIVVGVALSVAARWPRSEVVYRSDQPPVVGRDPATGHEVFIPARYFIGGR